MTIKVAVFPIGYLWDFDLNQVVTNLNKISKRFEVIIEPPVRNIGNADLYGFGYSFKRLFSLFPKRNDFLIQIGITAVPIENNYYGYYEEGTNKIIGTLFEMDEVLERAGTTREEYVSQTILTAILWHQYHDNLSDSEYMNLFHDDTRGCLFDFCGNKLDLAIGLRAKRIDSICRGKLIEGNVSEYLVEDIEEALNRMKTPSFWQSIEEGLKIPIFSFVLGGLILGLFINVISSLLLGDFNTASDYYAIIILPSIAVILIIANYIRILLKSKKRNYV
jgi:hypothetical protein